MEDKLFVVFNALLIGTVMWIYYYLVFALKLGPNKTILQPNSMFFVNRYPHFGKLVTQMPVQEL